MVRAISDRLKAKYAEVLGGQERAYLERMEGVASRMQDLIGRRVGTTKQLGLLGSEPAADYGR